MTPTRQLAANAPGVPDTANRTSRPEDAEAANAEPFARGASRIDMRLLVDARSAAPAAVHVTLGHVAGSGDAFCETVRDINDWNAFVAAHPGVLRRVDAVADIAAARAAGLAGVIFGFRNTEMLGGELVRIRLFARMGVRVIQLTHDGCNAVGDGAMVVVDRGLSRFGAEVVERLQCEGVLVDLAGSSEKTCLDALALARRPVAITHSGCRAVADHPRHKTDAELRLLAERGGVLGLRFAPGSHRFAPPMADSLLAHLEHALDVCGEDHVGVGIDGGTDVRDDAMASRRRLEDEVALRRRRGVGVASEIAAAGLCLPGLCGPTPFERLADLLAARGHGETRIAKILGGNFRRVFGEAWAF